MTQPLTDLLETRARLLRPSDDLIERALARCVRADLRRATGRVQRAAATQLTVVTEAGTGPTVLSQNGADLGRTDAKGLLPAGRIIAGYRIEGLLGRGGMGQVYRATQLSMGREVAFKVLSPRFARSRSFRERFLREARAAGRFNHPNLIAVHDVGEAGDLMFFSMELVAGRHLRQVLKDEGPFAAPRVADVARQVLKALDYAHSRGVVHRDIKPDNLMLTPEGVVKVADLGLSRLLEEETEAADLDDVGVGSGSRIATQAGVMMGTPHYMSPEQGRDAASVDHRTDLWSLGASLYHLSVGKPPYDGTTGPEIVLKAATAPLIWPEPGPAPFLRTLISRLMAKRPEDRPASASAVLAELDAALGLPRSAQPLARRRWRWVAGIVMVALLTAGGLILADRLRDQREWQEARAKVETMRAREDWAAALAAATAAERFGPPGRALANDLDSAWRTWSEARSKPTLAAIDQAMKDGRTADAAKALRDLPEDRYHPAVRNEVETRRDRLLDLALAPGDPGRPGGPAALLNQMMELAWRPFTFLPPENVRIDGAAATFIGKGDGRAERGLNRVELDWQLAFNKPLTKGTTWTMALGPHRLSAGFDGLILTQRAMEPQVLAPAASTYSFRLRRTPDGLQLRTENEAHLLVLQPDGHNGLKLSWKLPPEQQVTVKLRPGGMAARGR